MNGAFATFLNSIIKMELQAAFHLDEAATLKLHRTSVFYPRALAE